MGTVDAGDAMAASAAAAAAEVAQQCVTRRELDAIAGELVVGARKARRLLASTLAGGECTICLEALAKGQRARCLPRCHHSFHSACILQWLAISVLCPGK